MAAGEIAVQADMSKAADVKYLFDKVKEDCGSIDVLVNNAGIAAFQMINDLTEDAFHVSAQCECPRLLPCHSGGSEAFR
jgi:NAD(P)-dependent dehydrogenase (short-subunit alcohol dehydrogenase family)